MANQNVTNALINIQTQLNPLKANATSHHGAFANINQVMAVLQPHLDRERCAIIQIPIASSAGTCTLQTIFRHQPTEEEIVCTITIPMQRQNDPQAFGAAMTYGRRYSLLCLFGMVTEDDDAASSSYTLEKLLRELSAVSDLNELQPTRDKHYDSGYLRDRFWDNVYKILFDKKYNSLAAIAKQEKTESKG